MNRTILIGRLTKNPELRYTSNDIAVATFTLAVDRGYTNKDGEKETDFIPCVVWRKQAENVNQYCSKGSLVGVEGRIQVRSYEDNNGNRRYITEVVCDSVKFLDTKSTNTSVNETSSVMQEEDDQFFGSSNIDISDDDLPF